MNIVGKDTKPLAVQLIAFLKKQIADSRRPKLVVKGFLLLGKSWFLVYSFGTGVPQLTDVSSTNELSWFAIHQGSYPKLDGFHLPYSWNEKWLVQESTTLDADCLVADSKFMKVAFGVDFKILLFNPLVFSTKDLSRNLKLTMSNSSLGGSFRQLENSS
ncbi:hypothetical protein Tco_1379055 [Tanacetum coccineum]